MKGKKHLFGVIFRIFSLRATSASCVILSYLTCHSPLNRTKFSNAAIFTFVAFIFFRCFSGVFGAEEAAITHKTEDALHRVSINIEVNGHLKLNAKGKEVTEIPMKVNADIEYDETVAFEDDRGKMERRSARYYHTAKAKIEINKGTFNSSLSDDRRLIAAHLEGGKITLFSPQGPVTRDSLELIETPCDPLILPAFLPPDAEKIGSEKIKPGHTWKPSIAVLTPLFGIDAVSKSDVEATLKEIKGDVAIFEMAGGVNGAAGGVTANIKFKAIYHYRFSRKAISAFNIAINEERSIGHAEPGFSTATQMQIAFSPIKSSPHLTKEKVDELNLNANEPGARLLRFESAKAGFRMLHDREWRIMVDRHDTTIFRHVLDGDLIAQCNISDLPALPEGKQHSLEEFQTDIRRTLKDNFQQFAEASQTTTEEGLRVLRVMASGVTKKLPIAWIYYHISNEEGRRAAFVFTMESKLLEKFDGADAVMIRTFEFLDKPPTRAAAK